MTLAIDDSKTTRDLQERFSLDYPLLKLQFCKVTHGWQETLPEKEIIQEDILLEEIRKNHQQGTIEMKAWRKIGEIEREFQMRFGLNVQICYRSGGQWIQTGVSDSKTIKSLMQKSSSELNRVLL
ncbi:MAG: hypothetical protein JNK79_07320 [Chitinophagaceae bacterium]|nr:hypothetical protein [Chitinophagaceae bacterium]